MVQAALQVVVLLILSGGVGYGEHCGRFDGVAVCVGVCGGWEGAAFRR